MGDVWKRGRKGVTKRGIWKGWQTNQLTCSYVDIEMYKWDPSSTRVDGLMCPVHLQLHKSEWTEMKMACSEAAASRPSDQRCGAGGPVPCRHRSFDLFLVEVSPPRQRNNMARTSQECPRGYGACCGSDEFRILCSR